MYCCPNEPPLRDALADPVIRAMMTADRIDPRRMTIFLRDMARREALRQRRSGAKAAPAEADESAGR